MKVAVIGGGASGLFAAGLLTKAGIETYIFDGNEKLGKKIYITGKGRCNVTNNCDKDGYLKNVVHGQKFMYSAINQFDSHDTIEFFESLGCPLKTERGGRVFPCSDKASNVTKTLVKNIDNNFLDLHLNEKVVTIDKKSNFAIKTEKSKYEFDAVIVATGGKSYSATGSSGDGYKFAKMFDLNVVTPSAALVPIKIKDSFCSNLEGLSLKNVQLNAVVNGKTKSLFGEMMFTHDAITGPIALSLSSFIGNNKDIELSLDFKPALTNEKLEERILRNFKDNLNKDISYIIKGLLPHRLTEIFLNCCGIDKHKKVNSITVAERNKIIYNLKNFALSFSGLYPIESGIVTAGGVDLKEINPKTMESKKVPDLYFIGEVLDVDCLTGGYNLQTAFSTAYAAANAIILKNSKV